MKASGSFSAFSASASSFTQVKGFTTIYYGIIYRVVRSIYFYWQKPPNHSRRALFCGARAALENDEPGLDPDLKTALVADLMRARRAVGSALKAGDKEDEVKSRQDVDAVKHALGERGAVWWQDGAPDFNRHMVMTTPYADWFAQLSQ